MLSVPTITETPPGNWRAVVPETGYEISHYDYSAFMKAYEQHCVGNNIPLGPAWQDTLMDRMCRENRAWNCQQKGKFKSLGPRNNFGAIMSFLRMVLQWSKDSMIDGQPAFVEQSIAQERANICLTCPMNTRRVIFGCGSCGNAFISLLAKIMGNSRKVSGEENLGSCRLCGCALRAAVFVPLAPQIASLDAVTKERFLEEPVRNFCWKSAGITVDTSDAS